MKLNNKNTSLRTNNKQLPKEGKIGTMERPQSAKHRTPTYQGNKMKEEMMIVSSSSSNTYKKHHATGREELYRKKW